jgi:hypothetical protein
MYRIFLDLVLYWGGGGGSVVHQSSTMANDRSMTAHIDPSARSELAR